MQAATLVRTGKRVIFLAVFKSTRLFQKKKEGSIAGTKQVHALLSRIEIQEKEQRKLRLR